MSPLKIPIADYFQLNANDEFMGKDEKTVIRERLSSRENYDMEKPFTFTIKDILM